MQNTMANSQQHNREKTYYINGRVYIFFQDYTVSDKPYEGIWIVILMLIISYVLDDSW